MARRRSTTDGGRRQTFSPPVPQNPIFDLMGGFASSGNSTPFSILPPPNVMAQQEARRRPSTSQNIDEGGGFGGPINRFVTACWPIAQMLLAVQ